MRRRVRRIYRIVAFIAGFFQISLVDFAIAVTGNTFKFSCARQPMVLVCVIWHKFSTLVAKFVLDFVPKFKEFHELKIFEHCALAF